MSNQSDGAATAKAQPRQRLATRLSFVAIFLYIACLIWTFGTVYDRGFVRLIEVPLIALQTCSIHIIPLLAYAGICQHPINNMMVKVGLPGAIRGAMQVPLSAAIFMPVYFYEALFLSNDGWTGIRALSFPIEIYRF